MSDMASLEQKIGYTFQNKGFLRLALTHSSYANESRSGENNERQEFLGDAVLSIVVSDYLFQRFHMAEGDLTRIRASLVCEKSLCGFAREIGLGDHLLLGKGEEMTGGRDRASVLADAFEALIAAIYLDGGIEQAKGFILPFAQRSLEGEVEQGFTDYKTQLQEIVQKNPGELLAYRLVEETGPDHDKRFVVEVLLNSNIIGKGQGRSKKAAEQAAAKEALELMGQ